MSGFSSGQTLAALIAHLCKESIFDAYAPRVCFLVAQRYHALGRIAEARLRYQACKYSSKAGSEIHRLAQVSILCLDFAEKPMDERESIVSEAKDLQLDCLDSEAVTVHLCGALLACLTEPGIRLCCQVDQYRWTQSHASFDACAGFDALPIDE